MRPGAEPYVKRGAAEPMVVTLGTMNFGKRVDAKEAARIIDRAHERGVRWLDTANVYENGASEKIVGAALAARPGAFRVATKVGLLRRGGRPEGLARETVLRAAEESRQRLGVATLDLYYLHAPDHGTPLAESLAAMASLVASGAVAAYGLSNYSSWETLEAIHYAERAELPRPVVTQLLYNLLVRQLDVEYARFAERYAVPTLVYNALAGGLLARDVRLEEVPAGSRFAQNPMYKRRYWSAPLFAARERYARLAAELGMSLLDLAYRFLASSRLVDAVLVGPASVPQLDAALDALARPLSDDERARVDAVALELAGSDARYAR